MSAFIWPVRVYYEDTDAGGVVYYANYLKFMERARTEWLRSRGFEQDRLRLEQDILFVVRQAQIEYFKPARFNELLDVDVHLRQCSKASLEVEQEIHRAGDLLSAATIKLACVDHETLRPRRLPEALLDKLR